MTIDLAKLRAETLALIDGTTPGPWRPYGQSIKANGWCDTFDGAVLADVARAHDTEQADYEGRVWGIAGAAEANARLIAAAPTLAADTLRLLDEIERMRKTSPALSDVAAERQRQVEQEGWTEDNDDAHVLGEMAQAAACYALSGTPVDEAQYIHGRWKDVRDLFWPRSWTRSWWKPTDRRRDLVKAGALILAEIERLDRAALSKGDPA